MVNSTKCHLGYTLYITAPILDDLLRKVFQQLLNKKLLNGRGRVSPTKGPNVERTGVMLNIDKPRARLSRTERKGTLFSCLGEFLWYASGTSHLDFISYYIPIYDQYAEEDGSIHGAYGPRIFGEPNGQLERIISGLRANPASRKAVIQIFDAADTEKSYKDVPCTCTMQFLVRSDRLDMVTYMRSNDAFKGLPHDVFAFTMIQELVARSLGVELGTYKHAVGSLHLYDEDRDKAEEFLSEGWQSEVLMPEMPRGDPWPSLRMLLDAESDIRLGRVVRTNLQEIDSYWADLIRILQIFNYTKDTQEHAKFALIAPLKQRMASNIYSVYIDKREASHLDKMARHTGPEQLELLSVPVTEEK
jgi:thymidylate synthase